MERRRAKSVSKYIDLQKLRELIAFQASLTCAEYGLENVVIDVRIPPPPEHGKRRVEVVVRDDIDPKSDTFSQYRGKSWEDN